MPKEPEYSPVVPFERAGLGLGFERLQGITAPIWEVVPYYFTASVNVSGQFAITSSAIFTYRNNRVSYLLGGIITIRLPAEASRINATVSISRSPASTIGTNNQRQSILAHAESAYGNTALGDTTGNRVYTIPIIFPQAFGIYVGANERIFGHLDADGCISGSIGTLQITIRTNLYFVENIRGF